MKEKQEIIIDKKKTFSFILNLLLGFFSSFIILFIWMHLSKIKHGNPLYGKNIKLSVPFLEGTYYLEMPSFRELTYFEEVFELYLPALFTTFFEQFLLTGLILSAVFISRNLFLRHFKIKLK